MGCVQAIGEVALALATLPFLSAAMNYGVVGGLTTYLLYSIEQELTFCVATVKADCQWLGNQLMCTVLTLSII
jgi:hypothetical protein